MINYFLKLLTIFLSLIFASQAGAESFSVSQTSAEILSDGTKIHADLYIPKVQEKSKKLPVIIMAHGWGGLASHLRDTAYDFAKSGFYVVVFDYRGWGRSSGRLIQVRDESEKGKSLKIKELRELVDPLDQAEDYFNVINWVVTDPIADPQRIGLWGTSLSGGLVVYVAAREQRIKAIVSQIGSMGWGVNSGGLARQWNFKGGQRARGMLEYPTPSLKEVGDLKGGMIWEKLVRFRPYDDALLIKTTASLFIVAQNENLFSNKEHSQVAYDRISAEKKYIEIPGIKHYDIYSGGARELATKEALAWFEKYLVHQSLEER